MKGWLPCLSCWLWIKYGKPYPKTHTGGRLPESAAAGSHAGDVPTGTPESSESSPGWPLGQAPVSSSSAVSDLLRRASDHISKYAWNQEGIRLIAEINSVLSKEKP